MNAKRRVRLQILTMPTVALGVGGIAVLVLYNAAFDEQRARLGEIAQSRTAYRCRFGPSWREHP